MILADSFAVNECTLVVGSSNIRIVLVCGEDFVVGLENELFS